MFIRAAHAATKITVGRCRWWGLHKFGVPIKMISLSFPGRKAEVCKEKRAAFKQEITGLCATFALQICRVLRNYRKAVVSDVQTKNKHWDAVNRSFDWGPLMDETSDDDGDEADDDE